LNFTVSRSNINSPSPASSQLTIANIPSNATVAMSYVNPLPDQGWGAHGWLTISTSSPVSGTTGSATETVTVSTQPWNAPDHGFEAGTYTASITISGNSQTITVPVTLVVSAAPASTAIISQSLTGLFNQLGTFLKSL
jgi:hypothetical protein